MASNARERSALSDAVAAEIRAERARAQMLQDDVAEAAGLAPSTYMRFEKGERVMDVSQLRRLAEVFGKSASQILASAEANVNAEASQAADLPAPQPTPTKAVHATVHKSGSPVNHDQGTKVTRSPKR